MDIAKLHDLLAHNQRALTNLNLAMSNAQLGIIPSGYTDILDFGGDREEIQDAVIDRIKDEILEVTTKINLVNDWIDHLDPPPTLYFKRRQRVASRGGAAHVVVGLCPTKGARLPEYRQVRNKSMTRGEIPDIVEFRTKGFVRAVYRLEKKLGLHPRKSRNESVEVVIIEDEIL